jgi:transcriptional repressor of PBSX genes
MYSNRFKDIRITKGLTQKQVADDLNLSVIAIQNYENLRRKPAYDILIALADYFDVSLDYLVGRSDTPEVNK